MRRFITLTLAVLCSLLAGRAALAQQLPNMKFNDVHEVAPGVFFRYSAIDAEDKVPFGGCNNIWIVFKDYVFVYDANFPKEAGDVIAAIRKTTKLPIKYVLDSHHHGDHAYGNAIWAKEGASIIAQHHCTEWLKTKGLKEFADAGKGKGGRKDIAESFLKIPDVVFDEKLVLDDGTLRAEIFFLGHCHTPGDAFLYLPKHKILCTGDACVNGAFNYMGHSDSAAWIKNLEKAQQLDIKIICPGHGKLAHKDLLETQKKWFVELRAEVKKGINAGKDVDDILKSLDIPWYKDWAGVPANKQAANVKHVYDELTGRTMNWELIEDFGVYEGPSPTKDTPGWKAPKRIIIPKLMPAELNQLKKIAPDVLFVPVKDAEEAAKEVADADAVLGFATSEVISKGKSLRWIQTGAYGLDGKAVAALKGSKITLTDVSQVSGVDVSENALALLLKLSRNAASGMYKAVKIAPPKQLHGKTMLVIGLGGAGRPIAKRADAFGMRVLAIDHNSKQHKPAYVFSLSAPDQLMKLLPQADVVVLACPLNGKTKGIISKDQLAAMKNSAYLINVARTGLMNVSDTVDSLQTQQIAGVGMAVTDPTPGAKNNPLAKVPGVVSIVREHGPSPEARAQQWKLWRENIRRFVAGEPLLCVVEQGAG
jgi:phosphoglycerate dehydrogenase-like enzyme/glyoxylase-like metal-dependent hydrolase (beta-lactamase superfamily II)